MCMLFFFLFYLVHVYIPVYRLMCITMYLYVYMIVGSCLATNANSFLGGWVGKG